MISEQEANVAAIKDCYKTYIQYKTENHMFQTAFTRQRREMIEQCISTWNKSNHSEDFYDSEFRTFILKYIK